MAVDTWKNFEQSGRVSDYLAYRQSRKEEPDESGKAAFYEKGMGSYGSRRGSDGDGVKCHADWRV